MGADNCIFCKIANGDVPATMLEDGADVLAFRDIAAKAPTHILVIPRLHIASLNDAGDEHQSLLGTMMLVARRLAETEGIATTGYRLVLNTGAQGGQSVDHMHIHLLGGRSLGWPPG